jgi:signal transduction histidine kinase
MQRAAIVGQLAGGILHDFNNVLTVITGMIDILAEAVADEPRLAAAARLIDEAATRGAALTSHILAFARGRPAPPREVDVSALLVEASRILRPALGGIEVAVTAVPDPPPALADPGQLMAAILSLAIVARNAMPEGGKLTLGAVSIHGGDSLARERANEVDDAIAITVDAHGYGVVAGYPERFFIDVEIARDFVDACGGRLLVCAPSATSARAQIFLPKVIPAQSWLAGS